MKVMLDTNVLIDVFQKREPFCLPAARALSLAVDNRVDGVIASHSFTTVHYVLRKTAGLKMAGWVIDWLLDRFEVASMDAASLRRARQSAQSDFEDAIIGDLASRERCAFILTRDPKGYRGSTIEAIDPARFMERWKAGL